MTWALLLGSVAFGAPTSPVFTGVDPLFQWSGWAPEALATRLCFEGVALHQPGEWTLPPVQGDDMARAAAAALRATDYPARFRVIERSGRRVLVPEAVRSADGAWVEVTPLLDTRVDLEPRLRSAEDALGELLSALEQRTGERVLPAQTLNGQATTRAGGINIPVRDLMVQIFDDYTGEDHPSNMTWRLVWYEKGQFWFLNFAPVWSLGPPWDPPAPGSQPARRSQGL